MPRNSSGTYSRPAGQPVVTGTSISSTDHNTYTADVASELTDSLSRSGKGGMTAPLRVADGSSSAPSVSFSSETGTGIYRKGAANPAFTVTGSEIQDWDANGSGITGDLAVSDDFSCDGASVNTLSATGLITASAGETVSGGSLTFSQAANQSINKSDGDLYIGTTDTHALGFKVGNTLRWYIDASSGDLASTSPARKIVGVNDPTSAQDVATKNYIDVTAGTSAATNSALMRRDSSGRVSVSTPTSSDHAATKGYVDSKAPVATALGSNVTVVSSPVTVFNAVSCPAVFTFEALLMYDNESSCSGIQIGFQSSVSAITFWAEARNEAGTLITVASTTATVNMTLASASDAVGLFVVRGQFYASSAGTITIRGQRNGSSGSCIVLSGSTIRIL